MRIIYIQIQTQEMWALVLSVWLDPSIFTTLLLENSPAVKAMYQHTLHPILAMHQQ